MSQVHLSPETIKILKHFGEINQSIKIVPDQPLRSRTESKSQIAVAKLREEFPRQLCIYDLREFNQALGLFKKPVLDLSNEKFAVIQDGEGGRTRMRYLDAEEDLITSIDKDISMPHCEVELEITEDQLSSVLSAASVLKLPFIGFRSDGTDVYLCAFHSNDGDENETNSYSVRIADGDGTQYNLFLKAAGLILMPGNYKVNISSKKICQLENDDRGLTYFIGLEKSSEYGG